MRPSGTKCAAGSSWQSAGPTCRVPTTVSELIGPDYIWFCAQLGLKYLAVLNADSGTPDALPKAQAVRDAVIRHGGGELAEFPVRLKVTFGVAKKKPSLVPGKIRAFPLVDCMPDPAQTLPDVVALAKAIRRLLQESPVSSAGGSVWRFRGVRHGSDTEPMLDEPSWPRVLLTSSALTVETAVTRIARFFHANRLAIRRLLRGCVPVLAVAAVVGFVVLCGAERRGWMPGGCGD